MRKTAIAGLLGICFLLLAARAPEPAPPAAPAIESGPSAYPTQCPAEGQKISVAVYPIKPAGADASLAQAMTALLSSQLTPSPKLRVIEEAMLKAVMERQAMNISDACDDTVCQVAIGKLVQAQKLISGDLVKFGSKYVLSLKLTDVQSGTLDFAAEEKCSCTEDQLDQLVSVTAAKVRNHFCEQMPLPALAQPGAPSPAYPGTSPITAAPSGGGALVYLFYTANAMMGPAQLQLDNGQKFKLPKNSCVKTAVAPGNHFIFASGQSISYPAEAGGAYYFEAHFTPGPRMTISPVPGNPVPPWAPACQDLSQIQAQKRQ
jgi:hypothetical protein